VAGRPTLDDPEFPRVSSKTTSRPAVIMSRASREPLASLPVPPPARGLVAEPNSRRSVFPSYARRRIVPGPDLRIYSKS
jgi:hypothetical protein